MAEEDEEEEEEEGECLSERQGGGRERLWELEPTHHTLHSEPTGCLGGAWAVRDGFFNHGSHITAPPCLMSCDYSNVTLHHHR